MSTNEQSIVPPPPYKVPMINKDGTVSAVWANWFRQVFRRIGQEIALDNVQLENIQQDDLSAVQADVLTLQGQAATALATNNTQNTRLNADEADIEGLLVGPLP